MTWTCIGWKDAHQMLGRAFAKEGLSLDGLSTLEFLATRDVETSDQLIFAGSFMRYPADEREILCAQFTQRATQLLNSTPRPKVIFISSAAVYGLSPQKTPRREDASLQPQSAYAREKANLETALSDAAIASGGNCIVFRPAGLFGKTCRMARPNNLVDRMIGAIRSGEGLDLSIDDGGQQIRDFVHVQDLINVITQAASRFDRLVPPSGKLVLNVSNGLAHTVGEVVEAARVRALSISATYVPATTDAIHLSLDSSKLDALFDTGGFRRVIDVIKDTEPAT